MTTRSIFRPLILVAALAACGLGTAQAAPDARLLDAAKAAQPAR